jgi:hypothetical protein
MHCAESLRCCEEGLLPTPRRVKVPFATGTSLLHHAAARPLEGVSPFGGRATNALLDLVCVTKGAVRQIEGPSGSSFPMGLVEREEAVAVGVDKDAHP